MKKFHPRQRPQLTVVGSKSEDVLHHMLYEDLKVIRRNMSDVATYMPPITFRDVGATAKLPAQVVALLRGKTVEQIIEMLEGIDPALGSARRLMGLAKAHDVAQYIADSAANGSVFAGYWHVEVGATLLGLLRNAGIATEQIGGHTPIMERDAIAERFNSGETRVVLGQIAAAGVSLNLQKRCRHVIFGELIWSASKVEQFFKRVARLGQTQPVQVDYCIADNAIDEAMMAILRSKLGGINAVFDEQADFGF